MRTIGFGIIGCGAIAPLHAESLQRIRGAKLVAAADLSEANVKRIASEYGAIPYTDYRVLLARDDIQAVSLCVPSGMRAEIAEVCAAAGKHILAEKPLEVSSKRIDRIIRATDKAGVLLGCIFQSRFAEGPRLVRRAVEEGRFGKLVLGDAYIKWYRSPDYYRRDAWRGTRKLDGGGALMNQGIHQIDLLLWFMGPVSRVRAQKACIAHRGLEVEDIATAMLEFENGAFGVIEGSTAIWPGHAARVEVHGSEGSAVIEDGKLVMWGFQKKKPWDRKAGKLLEQESELGSGAGDPMSNLRADGHLRQIKDFVRAIRTGTPPLIDGREGRQAVHLIEMIYRAATTGRAVRV